MTEVQDEKTQFSQHHYHGTHKYADHHLQPEKGGGSPQIQNYFEKPGQNTKGGDTNIDGLQRQTGVVIFVFQLRNTVHNYSKQIGSVLTYIFLFAAKYETWSMCPPAVPVVATMQGQLWVCDGDGGVPGAVDGLPSVVPAVRAGAGRGGAGGRSSPVCAGQH